MENKDYLKLYTNIKTKYLSFLLTTFCRRNDILKDKIKTYYLENNLLSTEVYLEKKVNYPKIDVSEIDLLNFTEPVLGLIKNKIKQNEIPYKHQYKAWENILNNKNCIVATGTGSGKTECYLYPIYNFVLTKKDSKIKTIILYPLKALTKNQYDRIIDDINYLNKKYNQNISCKILDGDLSKDEKEDVILNPPDILLTNYVMLDRILIDPKYKNILSNLDLKYLILDEIHVYRGAQGIDVSFLVKRLQLELLKNNITLENIVYIGTSATLNSEDNYKDTFNFLYKIFNVKFCIENIVSYVPENNILKLNDVNLDSENYKFHVMFSKPNNFYKCLDCGKLYSENSITSDFRCSCGSNLVFELNTCRNCGEEYFSYFINSDDYGNTNKINLNDKFFKYNNNYLKYNLNNDIKILFLIDDAFDSENVTNFKLCSNCKSIFPNFDSCPYCKSILFKNIKVYTIKDVVNKEYINFKNKYSSNSNFCVKCNFKVGGKQPSLITDLSKISDENISHIIFDELYCNLDINRKILLFVDNVQGSSKFSREISETHIKNILRKELLQIIKNLESTISLYKLHQKIDDIFDDLNVKSDVKLAIDVEFFGELLAKEHKVGSIKNRKWIKYKFNIDFVKELDSYNKILHYMLNNKLIQKYYQLLKINGYNISDLKNNKFLKETLCKKYKFSEAHLNQYLNDLILKNIIISEDNFYLIKDSEIYLSKNDKVISEPDNYYDNWDYSIPIMATENDTGKTSPEKRLEIESNFKTQNNIILVATPTLELGVDIGDLNCVGQLRSPRSAANYVQRTGRAGRKNNVSSFAITYLEESALGGYYFYNPKELIAGKINPPLFDINLKQPIHRFLFSIFLSNILKENGFNLLVNNNWQIINNWIKNKSEIKKYWLDYYSGKFKNTLDLFNNNLFEIYNKYDSKIVYEWIDKLESCLTLFESNKFLTDNDKKYTLDYFRLYNLLPDFSFGNGGTLIKNIYSEKIISGFGLKESCPLNTVDIDKKRYSCKWLKVDQYYFNKNNFIYTDKYKECINPYCINYISTNNLDKQLCPICNTLLTSKERILFRPLIIDAVEQKYFNISKKVDWKTILIDLPDDFREKYNFECSVGLLFNGIIDYNNYKNNSNNYNICKKCGKIYNITEKKDNRCTKHEPFDGSIIDKYNTTAVYLNLNKYINSDLNNNLYLNKLIKLYNSLISSANIEVGCEDGEVNAIIVNNLEFIFFDTVEGGVGFVNIFSENLKRVIEKSINLCEQDCCSNGCIKCIGSYTRQKDLNLLDKKLIIPILKETLDNINTKL